MLSTGTQQGFFSLDIQNEYDPARPNDYEEIRRDRERQRVDAEKEAERQEELREQKAAQEVCSQSSITALEGFGAPPAAFLLHSSIACCTSLYTLDKSVFPQRHHAS